jgi:Ca2+-binding RTX toxin-like protein
VEQVAPSVIGVNTNAADAVPDFDLEVSGTKDLAIVGRGGADRIDGRGVPTTFGSRTFLPLELLSGGPGDDQLLTGGNQSEISGGAGRDLISGSPGTDELSGGSGRDTIVGGRGKDYVLAVDHKRDRIRCGPSRDHAIADPRDKQRGCETITRTGHRFPDPVVIGPFE